MKRLVLGLSFVVAVLGVRGETKAQPPGASATDSKASEAKPADAPPAAEPAGGAGTDLPGAITQTAPANPGEAARRTWQDVVVVPRKAFLKSGRLELFPMSGVTLNDVLIRHYSFGGSLNYYVSDVFSIGVEGQYYIKERTDRESVIGLQYNRVASLNRYLYSGALNFGYVPGYGKFTLFNRYIIHWDVYVQGGVGLIQTEIIPRKVGDATFKNNRIAPNLGVGTHLFLSNWLTFNVALKDYLFNDLYEPTNREQNPTWTIDQVKSNAESQFVHNIMIFAGLGLYLPTSFQYRTPR
jgi:outer membrane beta-barrel protein